MEGVAGHISAPCPLSFSRAEGAIIRPTQAPARLLLMAGEPIDAPHTAMGRSYSRLPKPFTTRWHRHRSGAMGSLSPGW